MLTYVIWKLSRELFRPSKITTLALWIESVDLIIIVASHFDSLELSALNSISLIMEWHTV